LGDRGDGVASVELGFVLGVGYAKIVSERDSHPRV
jgi:predicted RNA-binding protein with TRAM domain